MRVRRVVSGSVLGGLLFLAPAPFEAQEGTRAAEIEAQREEKSRQLEPEQVSKWEARLRDLKDKRILERFSAGVYGFRARLGGAATRQGFAVGPEYVRRDLFGGAAGFRANWQFTTRGGSRSEVAFEVPRRSRQWYWARAGAYRHNYNRIDFYGQGPDSEKTGRSNYRYEDVTLDGVFGVRLGGIEFGPSAGALWVNVGPGTDPRIISTDAQYGSGSVPGLDRQTRFARYGGFAGFDWLDSPVGPRSGGLYAVEYSYYDDVDLNRHNFHLLRAELEQYLPFYNRRRVVVLGARTDLTWVPRGQEVPFYLEPVIGGSEDLRGYRPYRFYGNNSMVLNAEYRWEVFAGMDAAIFADAGKVFQDKGQLNFQNLESDVGFGLRFNARNAPFLRIDVGFSHEGFQVWVKFNDVFVKKPLGRSSPKHIF
jgi:outer membrane protein assembly factor BamA